MSQSLINGTGHGAEQIDSRSSPVYFSRFLFPIERNKFITRNQTTPPPTAGRRCTAGAAKTRTFDAGKALGGDARPAQLRPTRPTPAILHPRRPAQPRRAHPKPAILHPRQLPAGDTAKPRPPDAGQPPSPPARVGYRAAPHGYEFY